jgi:hypothetical protein
LERRKQSIDQSSSWACVSIDGEQVCCRDVGQRLLQRPRLAYPTVWEGSSVNDVCAMVECDLFGLVIALIVDNNDSCIRTRL